MSLQLNGTTGLTFNNGSAQDVAGVGTGSQAWTSVVRSTGVTYTNTTGKPIMVNAWDAVSGNLTGYQVLTIDVNGVRAAFARMYMAAEVNSCFVSAIVPSGSTYVITISGSYNALAVAELR